MPDLDLYIDAITAIKPFSVASAVSEISDFRVLGDRIIPPAAKSVQNVSGGTTISQTVYAIADRPLIVNVNLTFGAIGGGTNKPIMLNPRVDLNVGGTMVDSSVIWLSPGDCYKYLMFNMIGNAMQHSCDIALAYTPTATGSLTLDVVIQGWRRSVRNSLGTWVDDSGLSTISGEGTTIDATVMIWP